MSSQIQHTHKKLQPG